VLAREHAAATMAVACGDGHTVMVGESGLAVFACGRGGSGQLGGGARRDKRVPARIPELDAVLAGARVVMVAAGEYHSAASTSTGEVLTWGSGEFGKLGRGDEDDGLAPARLGRELFLGQAVLMVSCGGYHTMALTRQGRVFTFGEGAHGQLGHGDRLYRSTPDAIAAKFFGRAKIVFVAAGYIHSGVVTSDGLVWTWGCGARARLGLNDERDQVAPRQIMGPFGGSGAVMMSAGGAHTMLVMSDGALWGCGYGGYGQLGLGDCANRQVPARVGTGEAFGQSKVLTVACGIAHTMAVTEDGGLWSWGRGYRGRLGHHEDDGGDRLVPTRLEAHHFKGAKVVTASCGHNHSAAVTEDGALFTWGQGAPYPGALVPAGLGHNNLEDKLVPTLVSADLLLGARMGRCLPLAIDFTLAFAMGTHWRLGAAQGESACSAKRRSRRLAGHDAARHAQACPYLRMPTELIRKIVDLCRDWPEGCTDGAEGVGAEGVVRLAGGGRLLKNSKRQ
jgi:alpha-tubulin suppressor-like RCC1 family protein